MVTMAQAISEIGVSPGEREPRYGSVWVIQNMLNVDCLSLLVLSSVGKRAVELNDRAHRS